MPILDLDYPLQSVADMFNLLRRPEVETFASYTPAGNMRGPKFPQGFGLWFRGHANAAWNLIPSVFRDDSAVPENALYWLFRLGSPELQAECRSAFDWLCFMRHALLPTRLLDWSENALIALFMACDDATHHGAHGTIWLLNTQRLHEVSMPSSDLASIRVPHFTDVALRAAMATEDTVDSYMSMISGLDSHSVMDQVILTSIRDELAVAEKRGAALRRLATPVAVYPYRVAGRMFNQHSVFTLHGGKISRLQHVHPGDMELPLPRHLHDLAAETDGPPFLARVAVDMSAKASMLQELRWAGISGRVVYPEATGLAKDLQTLMRGAV